MKINLSYKEININTFFCIILIIGFLTIGIIPAVFKMNSQIITIPFRAVVLFLSIFIIIRNFYTKQINKFGLAEFMFIVFWFFYLFKAFLTFKNYTFSEELNIHESETYLRIVGITFIPSLAVLTIQSKKLDYSFLLNFVFYTLFILLLLNVLVGIDHDTQGRSTGFFSMYSISFGHLGVTLVTLSLYKILFETYEKIYLQLIPFLGLIIGSFIMYSSGTRSPLIAFVLCVSFLFYVKGKLKYLYGFLLLIVLGILTLIYIKPNYSGGQSSSFFTRVTKMIVSGDSSGRSLLYEKGIDIFMKNPIFGGRILYFDGMYPHNIFIEILMATGIIGMIIYLFFFKNCIIFILNIKKTYTNNVQFLWIGILWLQYFILSLFSYNIHSSPEIWYFTAMLLVMYNSNIKLIKEDIKL